MSRFTTISGMLLLGFGLAAGCSQSGDQEHAAVTAPSRPAVPPDPAFLLTERPADVLPVGEAVEQTQSDDMVSIEGRIGGSEAPFVDGMAAFTIVDPKVHWCADDEGCPTPWDYCCNTDQLKGNMALVKIVGADGQPVNKDARDLVGVKELSLVVVEGKVVRDEQGNLTLLAEKVYVAQN